MGPAVALGFAVCLGVGALASASCSSGGGLVGPGGECFLATDCAPGLVCVEQPNKTRVCSDDLRRVAGRTPPEGGADEDGGPEADATSDASDQPPPTEDAGVRDSGVPDTGVRDTGVEDTGAPPDDDAGG
jgi:hypothetical protein